MLLRLLCATRCGDRRAAAGCFRCSRVRRRDAGAAGTGASDRAEHAEHRGCAWGSTLVAAGQTGSDIIRRSALQWREGSAGVFCVVRRLRGQLDHRKAKEIAKAQKVRRALALPEQVSAVFLSGCVSISLD